MGSLEDRLQALEDREAIRELIASYGPMADAGDAEGVASLWAEDGVYAIADMREGKGRAAIAGFIDAPLHRQLMADGCAHLLGPVTIELDGDQAIARGHSAVLHWTGEGFEVLRVAANRWELARGEQGWKVLRRDNAMLQGSEAARALLSRPVVPRRS